MRRMLSVIHGPLFGGGHNQTLQLAEPLRRRGWETLMAVPDLPEATPTLERMRAGGVPTGTLELHRLRRTVDPRTHGRTAAGLRREIGTLRGIIRRERIDLVQAFGDTNPHLALAGRLEGVPVVWHLYDTVTPPPARRVTMPVVTRLADVIMTTGRALAFAYPGAAALGERCITVYPPVDARRRFTPDPARRAAARRELGVPDDALLVGTVGNRNPTKGHDLLVEAVAGLDGAHCRILGAPSPVHAEHMAKVDALVRPLSGRVAIVDPGRRVPALLPAFDVFVISSVPRSEGMPTVILEALSCGIPVVSTDVGAVREVLEDGPCGIVVPPLDVPALSAAIGRLLADADERARLADAGRARALDRYDVERCADVYERGYALACAHRLSSR